MIRYMKIGEICDILNGYAFKSSRYINNKGIRVIRITNVQKGYIEDAEPKFYPEKEMNEIKKFMLEDGDLLISLTGNVGRVALIDKSMLPAALNQRVGCIRVNKKDLIYKPYLYHLLNSDYFEKQCINSSNGIAQKNMSTEWLKEYHIPVYSMDYQKKIATIFDKIDIVIKKHYKQVEILDKIAKSLFIEMFGDPISNPKEWKKKKCKNILTKIGSGATPQGGSESYKEEGISLIRSMNVHNGRFESKDLAYIDEKQAQKLDNVNIKENDVLINITGASVARCCIVPSDVIPARVNQHVSVLRCSDVVNSIFLCYQIINDSYQNLLKKIGTSGGATREAITKKQIEDLEVILPPLELQNKFANFVRGTDKSKLAVKKSLEELEILKKSLMQKYFA